MGSGKGSARRPSARQLSVWSVLPSRHIPRLDRDGDERFTSRERRVLIALTAKQAVAEHEQWVPAMQPSTGGQVFSTLLCLLSTQSQKERHRTGPQPDAALDAAVI